MHRGFTKRWRKRWDSGYHKDHLLWTIMDYAIDHARGTPGNVYLKDFNITIAVDRGDFIFSYRGLANTLGATVKQIRSRCGFIETISFWARKRAHPCMLVTLCNYNKYNPLNDTQGHSKGHTEGTPGAQYNECIMKDKRKERAQKRKTLPPENFTPTDQHRQRAIELNINCDLEAEKWLNYCFANNIMYADHNRAFSNWLLRAKEFKKQNDTDQNDDPCYARLN